MGGWGEGEVGEGGEDGGVLACMLVGDWEGWLCGGCQLCPCVRVSDKEEIYAWEQCEVI